MNIHVLHTQLNHHTQQNAHAYVHMCTIHITQLLYELFGNLLVYCFQVIEVDMYM